MPKSLVTGGPQNEVWIRGRKFLKNKKNLVVKFGNIPATIVQCETNLIIVQPPIIEDLTKELTVAVEISNVLDDQAVPAKENLTFTFLPNNNGKLQCSMIAIQFNDRVISVIGVGQDPVTEEKPSIAGKKRNYYNM